MSGRLHGRIHTPTIAASIPTPWEPLSASTVWGKTSKLYNVIQEHSKMGRCDRVYGWIAHRSLLRVRKRRFLFWAKALIWDLSGDRNNKYVRAVYICYLIYFLIPQTVLALRGSHGVALEAPMKSPALRRRCAGADFIDFYSTWWHLPSKTHSKIDKLKELLHLAWEVFNFWGSRLAPGLAWTPGGPWPRGAKAEVGQGSIWVKKWRKSESSQNGILYSGKS